MIFAAVLVFAGFVLLLLAYGRYLDADFKGAVAYTSVSGLLVVLSLFFAKELSEFIAATLLGVSIVYVVFVAALLLWLMGRPPL
jgi:presenilin-like A22 family membrane protease